MKSIISIGIACLTANAALAGYSVPPVIVLGQVRDEYGLPLLNGAAEVRIVDLSNNTNQCGYCKIDDTISAGVNYRITLPMEDKTPFSRPTSTLPQSPCKVVVLVGGAEQQSVPNGEFTAPAPGAPVAMNLSIAEDVDGDGLPDAWEELMVAWSGGVFSSIYDIDPDADPDGDGMSTRDEYLAGTFPFMATDVFGISKFDVVAQNHRLAITFASVSAKKYHVFVKNSLINEGWSPVQVSLIADGTLEYQTLTGTGRSMTIYVDGSVPAAFYQIGVE